MPAGHLSELFGNISDSTFDGTQNFGPLPTGEAWGAMFQMRETLFNPLIE
jgi:hypothetical protein